MNNTTVFDVIVVGAGVEGSATAYQLIKNGAERVLLLEQVKIANNYWCVLDQYQDVTLLLLQIMYSYTLLLSLSTPQFSSLHSRGSSHGSSRIICRAHTMPYYNTMMEEAYRMWRELEEESGTQLLV